MLEQSARYGRVFLSEQKGKYLVSRPADITEIQFGPMRPLCFYPVSDSRMAVEDREQGMWYLYDGADGLLSLTETRKDPPEGLSFFQFYYYGLARKQEGEEWVHHRYFVKAQPSVTWEGIPGMETIEIPLTLQRLDYDRTFAYPDRLNEALATIPACYVDRYKRPIRRISGQTFPVSMDEVPTIWRDLPPASYPKAVRFTGTPFGVLDLEPEHTKEDEQVFDNTPAFYTEQTPRGGSHKLVWMKDPGYKFRYSPGLELLGQTQATFYGINGQWIDDRPEPIDLTGWTCVGHTKREVKTSVTRPDVSTAVDRLKQKAAEKFSLTRELTAKTYYRDPDVSHADYVALYKLYHGDIKPYASQFPAEDLPWILEAYSEGVIPHREKHETLRNGLPYLVYLASIIIEKEG